MADRTTPVILGFNGGYATDLPSQARQLRYWLKAENIMFEVDGAVRKVGGATKINSTVIPGAPNIMGMFDFWRGGGASSPTQKFVAVTSDGKVYKEDMDGVFDDITGLASISVNAMPIFCVAEDLLLMFFSTNDTPLKWNQTGDVATLAGSPPACRGAVYHAGRVWVWGANANDSRITYSAYRNAEDYTGIDTGSFDIDEGDGDRIVGAISYKKSLIVFKGPNIGSIHVISGSAPTGADGFRREPLVKGIPLQTHNSILAVGDDVAFQSNRGIHLLSAVQQFGNFSEQDVTRYLKSFFRDDINRTNLDKVWAVNYSAKSAALWAMTQASASENDLALGMSYIKFEEEGFKAFIWKRDCFSAALRKHPTTKIDEVVFGGTDGFIRRQDTAERNIDSTTAYAMRLLSPQLLLGANDAQGKPEGDQPFNLERMYMRSVATGDYDIQVSLTRDNNQAEAYTFNQGLTGFMLDVSVLDVDTIGGNTMQLAYSNPGAVGEAKAVQLDITQGGFNEDAYILEVGINIKPTAHSQAS